MQCKENIDLFFRPFVPIVDTIALQFGRDCEVALHDLRQPQSSLIAISGNLTKRVVGAPITDYVLRLLQTYGDAVKDRYIYSSSTQNGRKLKSSTTFLRDEQGHIRGCLCVNYCLDGYYYISKIVEDLCSVPEAESEQEEHYSNDITEIAEGIMKSVLDQHFLPFSQTDRAEKLAIVKELDRRGLFLVKGAVEIVADRLDVSKYTLYTYIDETKKASKNGKIQK